MLVEAQETTSERTTKTMEILILVGAIRLLIMKNLSQEVFLKVAELTLQVKINVDSADPSGLSPVTGIPKVPPREVPVHCPLFNS
jgi:hypothetical protein